MRRLAILVALVAGCASPAQTQVEPSPTTTPALTTAPTPRPILGAYFYDMSQELFIGWPFDKAGIVTTPDGHYNAVTIEQDALEFFALWRTTGSPENRAAFLRYADWLVNNQAASGLWLYDYQVWTMTPPWHSALSQGQGISVLLRAWQTTGEARYLDAATAALQTFTRAYADGGVAAYEGPDTFFEEYDPACKPHVLNGWIFSLVGVYEYHAAVGDALSGQLFDTSAATLARNLQRYDTGTWTLYSLATPVDSASGLYAGIHVAQVQQMWLLTGNPIFREYAARWAAYLAPKV